MRATGRERRRMPLPLSGVPISTTTTTNCILINSGNARNALTKRERMPPQAEEVLARNKVDSRALKSIQDAERGLLTANAQLQTGAPSVLLRGLADCRLSVDDVEVKLGKGEVRTISVADRSRLTIPGVVDVEITAGSSAEGLSRKVEDARRVLDDACAKAGVSSPDEARTAFEERREATRHVESKAQVEKDNLRDLTYEELDKKLLGLQQAVPGYLAKRVAEPAICPDLDSAKKERANAESLQQETVGQWESARESLDAARSVRDGLNTKHQELRVQLDLLSEDLNQARENLDRARKSVPDDALETALANAVQAVASEDGSVRAAETSLKAKNPERVKALAETARGSLQTTLESPACSPNGTDRGPDAAQNSWRGRASREAKRGSNRS